jgi:hypothetical protein
MKFDIKRIRCDTNTIWHVSFLFDCNGDVNVRCACYTNIGGGIEQSFIGN